MLSIISRGIMGSVSHISRPMGQCCCYWYVVMVVDILLLLIHCCCCCCCWFCWIESMWHASCAFCWDELGVSHVGCLTHPGSLVVVVEIMFVARMERYTAYPDSNGNRVRIIEPYSDGELVPHSLCRVLVSHCICCCCWGVIIIIRCCWRVVVELYVDDALLVRCILLMWCCCCEIHC